METKKPIKMSRLDFYLISEDLHNLCIKSDIIPGYRTDHSAITLELNLSNVNTRGNGFFKLNTSILKDIEYCNRIKQCINNNIERYAKPHQNLDNRSEEEFEISDLLFLDTLKMEIRRESIRYSSNKKRNTMKTENDLKKDISILEIRLAESDTVTEQLIHELESKRER